MMMRTETCIKENWEHHGPPLISIVCVTYNHEQYITDAIESFLMQETDFSFEIIIQDDASTDNTPKIIQKYAEIFPNIIRPIFHQENQFSQNKKNVFTMAVSHANGKYIACCEGDDFWIDKNKLQIQIKEMKKNPDCDVSIHPVIRQCAKKQIKEKIVSQHSKNNKIFTTTELILGTAKFCPMASVIFNVNIFKSIPDWFFDAPVGDYFLQILSSLRGGILYINKVMAVYRVGSLGSWSERISRDESFAYDYFLRMLVSIQNINIHTQNKYEKEFTIVKNKICFFMCVNPVLSFRKRKMIFEKNKELFSFKNKLMWYFLFRNKRFFKLIFYIRNYIFD